MGAGWGAPPASRHPLMPIMSVEDGWISAISDEMMVRKQIAMVMMMATAV